MKAIKAINDLAVFILQNKKDVITLINRQGLASLPYDASIERVNEIVIDNPLELEEGLQRIGNTGYTNVCGTGLCIGIVVAVIAIVTTTGVVLANKRAARERDEVYKDNLRSRYLTKEQLAEIAYLDRQGMQRQFLMSQAEFLQKEEKLIQSQREDTRKNTLYVVIGGIITVMIGAILMNRYE
jgi:hypothetical protein|tara:strand:- start:5132 stop:5680 length:549 start_codon:yes stop_codon:yes gene_type:complete